MELLQQIKEFLIPELEAIRQEQSATRERLNAIDLHLVDQSRRIDALNQRIDETNKRIDETNQRIDKVRDDLLGRIEKVHSDLLMRIDETNKRIDKVQADYIARFDETHRRLDKLYEVIVRRDEHDRLESWVQQWARDVERRLAALERKAA